MVLKRKRDYIGKKVRTLRNLQNSLAEIPRGTICEVIEVYGGATLKTKECPNCLVMVRISRVPYIDIELIEEPKSPPAIKKRLENI